MEIIGLYWISHSPANQYETGTSWHTVHSETATCPLCFPQSHYIHCLMISVVSRESRRAIWMGYSYSLFCHSNFVWYIGDGCCRML